MPCAVSEEVGDHHHAAEGAVEAAKVAKVDATGVRGTVLQAADQISGPWSPLDGRLCQGGG